MIVRQHSYTVTSTVRIQKHYAETHSACRTHAKRENNQAYFQKINEPRTKFKPIQMNISKYYAQ